LRPPSTLTYPAEQSHPYRYLRQVFEVMPTLKTREELKKLLPWHVTLPDRALPGAWAA